MKKGKRVISAVLAAILCVSSVPLLRSANAAELADTEDTVFPSGGNTEDPASPDTENENSEDTGRQSGTEGDAAASSDPTTEDTEEPAKTEDIRYNLGDFEYRMTDITSLEQMYEEAEERSGNGDDSLQTELLHYQAYGEDSNYTIELEQNAYFPYEVQFTENGTVTEAWFMTPDDTVTVGGHVFSVHSQTDGTVVTQMSLKIAGDTVTVFPEKKTFTKDGQRPASGITLLPIESRSLIVDLSKYTPVELTRVSVKELFSGEEKLKDAKEVVWTRLPPESPVDGDDFSSWEDSPWVDYIVNQTGDQLDLTDPYNVSDASSTWDMIVGKADQLEKSNIRYKVTVNHKSFSDWLQPVCYFQKADGERVQGQVGYFDYDSYGSYLDYEDSAIKGILSFIIADNDAIGDCYKYDGSYISIHVREGLNTGKQYDKLKAFEGVYDPDSEDSGIDITNKLFESNMSHENAGYDLYPNDDDGIVTLVSYNEKDEVTGCLPIKLNMSIGDGELSLYSIQDKDGNCAGERHYTEIVLGKPTSVNSRIELYKGYPANAEYNYRLEYRKFEEVDQSAVKAAYVGDYDSIEVANAANAVDVKDSLFGTSGYTTSQHTFTIFFGENGKEKCQFTVTLETTDTEARPDEDNSSWGTDSDDPDNDTYVEFSGLRDSEGSVIDARVCDYKRADSYAEGNYITILTKAANLEKIALDFKIWSNIILYSQDGKTVNSGKTCFDFSKGPVQFTAVSASKLFQQNYWVQVINPDDSKGAQQLYINSLKDPDAHTKEEGGVIYSTREVILRYSSDQHDILIVNRGKDPIPNLSAELQSDIVELDEYWTLKGISNLENFAVSPSLSDLAKIRIRTKKTATVGSEITGTLIIKSGNTKLMELTLTGTVGDPMIITETLPQAVKYAPYGTMIQNNNKYSRNQVSYELIGGELPEGIELKENGELYGVPKELGEFTFEVCMHNSYGSFTSSTKEFTLTVLDNTDENVELATDESYRLIERIGTIDMSSDEKFVIVSEGPFDEFQDVYLDGDKLTRDTDYSAESGSTRITISAQTLKKDGSEGTHTIGIEFRNAANEVKKAVQNYKVTKKTTSDNGNIGGNENSGNVGGGSTNSGGGSTNNGGSGGSSSNNSDGNNNSGGSNNSGGNSGNNNATGDIENSNSDNTPNTIVDIITKARRMATLKKPKDAIFQNLFNKRKIKKGAADLLEVIEHLFCLNSAG